VSLHIPLKSSTSRPSAEESLIGRAARRPGRDRRGQDSAQLHALGPATPWHHDLGVPERQACPRLAAAGSPACRATGCPAGPSEVAADTALPVLPSYVRALARAARLALGCDARSYTRAAATRLSPRSARKRWRCIGLSRARCGAASGDWPRRLGANTRSHASRPIEGASHAESASIQHVQVRHRRRDIRMAEQLLNGTDVVAAL
jgi:hypothetical protein